MRHLVFITGLALWLGLASCTKHEVDIKPTQHTINVEPIFMTIDVNIRIQRELGEFFDYESGPVDTSKGPVESKG